MIRDLGVCMPKVPVKRLGNQHVLKVNKNQVITAKNFGQIIKTDGGYQKTFRDLSSSIQSSNGSYELKIYDVMLDKLKNYARRDVTGGYQDWCREVLKQNGISW
jgi:hypothetical protein